ncbi:CYBP-like protein [Mya arenaria]|uniref:CYBP-like protein n=1 Tax=Mya arenaria TaxID=6604 RepID=A0ABY7GBH0_MYAAR|nr:CYBP-like protein [Mya arenaria]
MLAFIRKLSSRCLTSAEPQQQQERPNSDLESDVDVTETDVDAVCTEAVTEVVDIAQNEIGAGVNPVHEDGRTEVLDIDQNVFHIFVSKSDFAVFDQDGPKQRELDITKYMFLYFYLIHVASPHPGTGNDFKTLIVLEGWVPADRRKGAELMELVEPIRFPYQPKGGICDGTETDNDASTTNALQNALNSTENSGLKSENAKKPQAVALKQKKRNLRTQTRFQFERSMISHWSRYAACDARGRDDFQRYTLKVNAADVGMEAVRKLRLDAEELRKLLALAERKRVKDLLTIELRKVETEITAHVEREAAAANQTSGTAPKPVSTKPRLPTVDIKNYAWDQSEKSFNLRCSDVKGKNYTCEVVHLMEPISPQDSLFKVKTDMVLVMLKKKETGKTWPYVTVTEKKVKDKHKTPAMDKDADPNEGLMTMMKQMYEDGDDEMKRTIAKAWTESRGKQGPGDML